jgi:NADH-quinone oxidoreductase subunit G
VPTHAVGKGKGSLNSAPETIVPANDILFTSGTLGRYSNTLNSVMENRRKSPGEITIPVDAIK